MTGLTRKKLRDIPIYFKILIIICLFALFIISFIVLFQETVLRPSVINLEEEYSIRNLKRTENVLQREIDHLDMLLQDWCYWDDTYYFAETKNPEYISSNLPDETFYSTKLNLLYIYDKNQNLVWGKVIDLLNEKDITSSSFTDKNINNLFINRETGDTVKKGFLETELGLFLLSSRPILKSDQSGIPAGTMIMGKIITKNYLNDLIDLTQNEFHLYTGKELLSSEEKNILFKKNTENVIIYKKIPDIHNKPAIILECYSDRSISRYGSKSIFIFRNSILLFTAIMIAFLIFLLSKIIIKPLNEITEFIKSMQKSHDTRVSLQFSRNDEIGFLAKAIDEFLEIITEQKDELNMLNGELQEQATTDALTGLFNRHIMDTTIPNIWKTLTRNKGVISTIILDIDFFKKYNDTYGHQEGDECIKSVAEQIRKSLHRTTDMAIRYGGEEFLVILPSTPGKGALVVAQSIQEAIKSKKIIHESSKVNKYLTVSVGVSTMIPAIANNLDLLIDEADKALYESKNSGRDRITIYSEISQ